MRPLLFILALLVTVVLETSVAAHLYWGLLAALLINFLFERTPSYLFLVMQAFLVAMLRLDPWLALFVVGDLFLLKLAELLTFHFSQSRDSWLRYTAGAVIVVAGHFIMLYVPFWQYLDLLIVQLLSNVILGLIIWFLVRPFQRWLSPPQFAVLAK